MAERITYIITLECRHTKIFQEPAPSNGEIIWCTGCNTDRRVISAPPEIRIRCQKCVYSRNFGRAQVNAEIAAAKHRMGRPSHVVLVMDGRRVLRRFPREDAEQGSDQGSCDRDQIVTESDASQGSLPGF